MRITKISFIFLLVLLLNTQPVEEMEEPDKSYTEPAVRTSVVVYKSARTVTSWKEVEGIVTAYSPYEDYSGIESDGNPFKTSTGVPASPEIMAVDPALIPYGSEIRITYADGTERYGIAGDTGGALRTNGRKGIYHVDTFFWSYNETIAHGVHKAKIAWRPKEEK